MMAKQRKRGPRKQAGVVTWTRLSPEDRKAIDEIADREYRSTSQQIAHALGEWLKWIAPPDAKDMKSE